MSDLSESYLMQETSASILSKTPLVYILLLNWNGWKDTIECVSSCLKLTYSNYHILIIDNGSTDGSEQIIRQQFPQIEILQTGQNFGYAGGNNKGIRLAIQKGAQYIWILNNDTSVEKNALMELVRASEMDKDIGVVGSKIYIYDNPNKIWFAGGCINYFTGDAGHIGFNDNDHHQYDKTREVDYITGCSMLIKREVIDRVGLMDERFFLYYEETDWNVRIKDAGYKILYVPTSYLWHKCAKSLSKDNLYILVAYYFSRNALLFMCKHRPFFLIYAILVRLVRILKSYADGDRESASYALKGIRDFIIFKFGEKKM